jgi:hypothetical protein
MRIQFEAPDRHGREQLFIQYLMSMKLATAEVLQPLQYDHHLCNIASVSAAATFNLVDIMYYCLAASAGVLQQLFVMIVSLHSTARAQIAYAV